MNVLTALEPIRRILVGHRPGSRDTAELELALAVARPLGARVRVVEVEATNPLLERLGVESRSRYTEERFGTSPSPNELAETAGFPIDRLEVESIEGRARTVLLREAHDWQADLVVIGPARPETLPRRVLGTVTDYLVRNLDCPLLVATPGSPFPPHRVLLPVDLSSSSEDAAACGLGFLEQTHEGAALPSCEALLVVPPETAVPKLEWTDRAAALADLELASWLENLTGAPAGLAHHVLSGEPATTIVETAGRAGADLVILGTHGHGAGPIQRQMVGSVVAPVLLDPPCNVLLVPPTSQFGAELAGAVHAQTAPEFQLG